MRRTTRLAAGAVALLLVSGTSALAQSPAASDEAWTKSDVLAGFDPLSVDLEGSTPGPNGEQSVAASDIADPTPECLDQVKGLKVAFLNGLAWNLVNVSIAAWLMFRPGCRGLVSA